MGRNRTARYCMAMPCSVGRPTAHAPGPPAALRATDDDDRHQRLNDRYYSALLHYV